MKELRADYWTGVIGVDRDANVALLADLNEWMTQIGDQLVARGYASSVNLKNRVPNAEQVSAGNLVLYAVSSIHPEIGATLAAVQSVDENPLAPGRADGLRVHAQRRVIVDGHWQGENITTDPIYLPSLESEAVIGVLQLILGGKLRHDSSSGASA